MYKIIDDNHILYVPENVVITLPAQESYGHAYSAWLEKGNAPAPASAAATVWRQFTSLDFLALFSPEEQLAVASATMTNAAIKLWYDKMLAAAYVTLADSRTEAGLTALAAAGLISAERKEQIMTDMAA